jgi:hypothetical protein
MKLILMFLIYCCSFDTIDIETNEVTKDGELVAYLKKKDKITYFQIGNSYYIYSLRRNKFKGKVIYLISHDNIVVEEFYEVEDNIYKQK